MFLTRKQVIQRFVKKVLYGTGCFLTMQAIVFLMMLMAAKHHEIHQWIYGLFGR